MYKRAWQKNKINGNLLRFMTLKELKSYLNKPIISPKKEKELTRRTKEFLYLSYDNREFIFTEKNIIQAVKDKLYNIKKDIDSLKGHTAYPGIIKGTVYNASEAKRTKIPKNYILVISQTSPKETPLIKRSLGIVTNEGGILSHAAIISRELKKPCIIGTKIATRIFKTGDKIEVNSDKGIVKKL